MKSTDTDGFIRFLDKIDTDEKLKPLHDILVERYGSTNANITSEVITAEDKNILKVVKYLGLDYELDSVEIDIDYSFVENDRLRNTLEADYREMLRFRLGLRGHKIDFKEFCSCVFFQLEGLLNYFYEQRFASMEIVKEFLKSNSKYEEQDYHENPKDISFSNKNFAFLSFYKDLNNSAITDFHSLWVIVGYIKDIRNDNLHRSTLDDANGKNNKIGKWLNYNNGFTNSCDVLLKYVDKISEELKKPIIKNQSEVSLKKKSTRQENINVKNNKQSIVDSGFIRRDGELLVCGSKYLVDKSDFINVGKKINILGCKENNDKATMESYPFVVTESELSK